MSANCPSLAIANWPISALIARTFRALQPAPITADVPFSRLTIGIGGNLAAPPSHTTGHTGPYPAVQRIEHRRSFTPCRGVRHWSPSQRLRYVLVGRAGLVL